MDDLRAAAILALQLLLLFLGAPGLDFLRGQTLDEPAEVEAYARKVGHPLAGAAARVAWFNGNFREPITARLDVLQRPLRLNQLWHLYRDGAYTVRRLEIRVDDRLVYRSNDPTLRWLARPLRNRRIRPVVDASCGDVDAPNADALTAWVARRARDTWPDVSLVTLTCTAGDFPGTEPRVRHAFETRAPTWVVRSHRGVPPPLESK